MRLAEEDRLVMVARTDREADAETVKPEYDGEGELSAEELARLEAEDAANEAEPPEDDTEE